MGYLMLAILSSAAISIAMRWSEDKVRYRIGMLAVNYLACTLLAGVFAGPGQLFPADEGMGLTLGLGAVQGILFLLAFVLLEWSIRKNGVVLSSIFMKLGLLVPMILSMAAFHETPGLAQILGFGAALTGIVLMNLKRQDHQSAGLGLLLLLLCGGAADAMSKVFDETGPLHLAAQFLFYTFLTAFLLCIAYMGWKKQRIGKWEWCFGCLLGVPNFFSARFLLQSLESLDGVIAYPTFSVATILLVTLAGILIFRERLSKRQWAAAGIIVISLALLNIKI